MMFGVPSGVANRSLRRGRQEVWVPGGGPFRVMRQGQLHGYGIGDAAPQATGGNAPAIDSFTAGISLWMTPTIAVQALGSAVSGFGSHPMTSLGILTPPLILVGVALMMFSGGRRR